MDGTCKPDIHITLSMLCNERSLTLETFLVDSRRGVKLSLRTHQPTGPGMLIGPSIILIDCVELLIVSNTFVLPCRDYLVHIHSGVGGVGGLLTTYFLPFRIQSRTHYGQ